MKKSSLNRLLSLLMAVAMVLTLTVPAMAAQTAPKGLAEVENSFGNQLSALQKVQMDDTEDARDPDEEVRVSIVLDKKSTIQAGYAPIGIASNSEAMDYRHALKLEQDKMTETIESAIGGELDVVWNLTLAANLISANIKYGQMETIAAIPGVLAVFEETTYTPEEPAQEEYSPNMAVSKSQIGSETAWNAGYTGAGTKIAIIDTGIDPLHEAFNAAAFEYSLDQLDGDYDLLTVSDIEEVLTELNAYSRRRVTADDLYYGLKIPFGFNYAEDNLNFSHSYEAGEHGSHVAGISAANKYIYRSGSYRKALDYTGVQGVAPDAQLLAMNVFGNSAGCSSSDYMVAIEDALILGCDSVNLSLGSGNPGLTDSFYYEEILNELINSGVVVAMSAGNSGHWYDGYINDYPFLYLDDVSTHTGGSPGTYTNSLCVASVNSAEASNVDYYTMSSFSSWGVPGSLIMKPEITAPGGYIDSVAGYVPGYITDHDSYETMSGTSMASPQVAGMAAVLAQYIRENGLDEKTGLDARTLAQSLLMSTAVPMIDKNSELYYPILRQGAGLGHVGNAVTADSFIMMGKDATASWADGKVKAELGDDPNRTGTYTFSFTIHNITGSSKTYDLSADVFTMGCGQIGEVWYMDRIVDTLEANVSWSQPGKADKSGMDFNGDGAVSDADGDHLLKFIAGSNVTLHNRENADINGDGKITSYDAYLFFTLEEGGFSGSSITIPANGSADLQVTIRLTEEQKKVLDQYYVNGAYIQAYVFAESDTTSHSIPVLGYYGSWTEPSMYDKGSFVEYQYGLETRTPYLYTDLTKVNTVVFEDEYGDLYHLGGNPATDDAVYRPERNAINTAVGRNIYSAGFTLIRNAGEAYAFTRNTTTGEYLYKESLTDAGALGAFYYVNAGQWYNHWYDITEICDLTGIAENTHLEVGVVMVPEYYTLRESYSLDELGDGAFMTVPVTIDNTNPSASGYELVNNDTVLRITATDNQYVAAVALLDANGELLTFTGSRMDATEGQTLTYDIDVSEVVGKEFYIQVYDYASNIATYKIEEQIGKLVDYVTGVTLSDTTLSLGVGSTYTLTAEVKPANASDRRVSWSTNNSRIATVDANGVVTGVSEGTTTITATSMLDHNYKATCEVTVSQEGIFVEGILSDNMEGATYIYDWNVAADEEWTARKELSYWWFSSAVEIPGTDTIYACEYDTYRLYKINSATGSIGSYDDTLGYPFSDMAYSSFFSTSSSPKIHGIYDTYFFPARDPENCNFLAFNCESYMASRTGATRWLAIESLGYETYNSDEGLLDTEHILLLDNKGYIWNWWVYETDGGFSAYFNAYSSNLTSLVKLGVRIDDNDNPHSFHSMHLGNDGRLYLSSYDWLDLDDGTRLRFNDILALELNGTSYYLDYLELSGANVYPTTITDVNVVGDFSNAAHKVGTDPADAIYHISTEDMTAETGKYNAHRFAANVDLEAMPVLKAVDITAKTESAQVETKPQATNTVTVELIPKDHNGDPVANTNGMFQVMYDPAHLTLDLGASGMNGAEHFAVHDSGSGLVTIAYVGPAQKAAGEKVATLVFENKATANTAIFIKHNDYNDQESGHIETIPVESGVKLVEWISASTTLGGNIGLNFYVKLADVLVNDSTTFMRFNFDGTDIDVPLSEAVKTTSGGVTQYRFTCPVNAKNMTDEVTAQVMNASGKVEESKSLTVATYCNYMIQYGKDPELADLMKAMLNYGAAAQILFGHNVNNLANASLSDADRELKDVDASQYASSVSGSEAGIALASASLMLETETSIRIYFKLTGFKTIDDYTFYVDGVEVKPQQKGTEYYVEILDIAAQDLDEMHTVTVGGLSVRYGGLSYVNTVLKNQSIAGEELVDTAKALYAYNKLAEAYFN